MNLYLITLDGNIDYDMYDSAVVCAESYHEARWTHPNKKRKDWDGSEGSYGEWGSVKDVKVKLIGTAKDSLPKGVVCASFNAG